MIHVANKMINGGRKQCKTYRKRNKLLINFDEDNESFILFNCKSNWNEIKMKRGRACLPWCYEDEFERHFSGVILFCRRCLKSTSAGIRLRREVIRLQIHVAAHLDVNQWKTVGVGKRRLFRTFTIRSYKCVTNCNVRMNKTGEDGKIVWE